MPDNKENQTCYGALNYETPVYGKLYYDTGELKYEGYYSPTEYYSSHHSPNGRGISYYKNGKVYRDGQFYDGLFFEGKAYYPTGKLKFEGRYNRKTAQDSYYGPTYPVYGKFYGEDGNLIYEGKFSVVRQGSVGYPKVIFPEGFGSLE